MYDPQKIQMKIFFHFLPHPKITTLTSFILLWKLGFLLMLLTVYFIINFSVFALNRFLNSYIFFKTFGWFCALINLLLIVGDFFFFFWFFAFGLVSPSVFWWYCFRILILNDQRNYFRKKWEMGLYNQEGKGCNWFWIGLFLLLFLFPTLLKWVDFTST